MDFTHFNSSDSKEGESSGQKCDSGYCYCERCVNDLYLLILKSGFKPHRDESKEKIIKRISVLNLSNRKIRNADNLSLCKGLRILYLYKNFLSDLGKIVMLSNLTHLYLEQNNIQDMSALISLSKLQKLNLDRNRILRVQGLENCLDLTELSIENQRLEENEHLTFDAQSLITLGNGIKKLKASGNKIVSSEQVCKLHSMEHLVLRDNGIGTLQEVERLVSQCIALKSLDLRNNPVCNHPRYRDFVILNSNFLQILDEKLVPPNQRSFLKAKAQNLTGRFRNRQASEEPMQWKSSSKAIGFQQRSVKTKPAGFGLFKKEGWAGKDSMLVVSGRQESRASTAGENVGFRVNGLRR